MTAEEFVASQIVALDDGRVLVIDGTEAKRVPPAPFVTLLLAWEAWDAEALESLAARLLDRGCIEFYCVGPNAEVVHDAIDWIVEAKGLQTVTTWHEELEEAADFAVVAAALASANLLALVERDPVMIAMLERAARRD